MLSRLSVVQKNIVANFLGQGWSFAIGLVTIPFYIKFLGIEAYGLIGIYATIQAILNSFLDFGFSVTLNRELARASASQTDPAGTRDLVRTMEVIYWLIGLGLGALVCLAAGFLARYWVQAESLPVPLLTTVFVLMGAITFVQWPLTLYQAGLMGLQKMVLLNLTNSAVATVRGVGGVLLIWLIAPNVVLLFAWQVVVGLLHVLVTAGLLWHNLPRAARPAAFHIPVLDGVWKFAAGMTITSSLRFLLSQADRIILSKLLSLENFGYYSLASTLHSQLQMVSAQIYQAFFPRFSALAAAKKDAELRGVFHSASQLMTVVMVPLALVGALFSRELITVWLQDAETASLVAPIAALLFIGTGLKDVTDVAFSVTVAAGWVRFGIYRSLISLAGMIPLLVVLSANYGGIGAAMAWFILGAVHFIFQPGILHRHVLKGEAPRWYLQDVLPVALAAALVAGAARVLIPEGLASLSTVLLVGAVLGLSVIAAILAADRLRPFLRNGLAFVVRGARPAG